MIHECNRDEWSLSESWQKTLSETCLALVYVLVLIRANELLYVDRTFGKCEVWLHSTKEFLPFIGKIIRVGAKTH